MMKAAFIGGGSLRLLPIFRGIFHKTPEVFLDGEIRLIDAFGVKYDSYFDTDDHDPVRRLWIDNIDLFTLVVCIDRQYFALEQLPERVPLRFGLGTYEYVLRETSFPLPHNVSVFPEGHYVSFFLALEEGDSMPGACLEPVRTFLRGNGLRAVSDSTAYLYRVDRRNEMLRFVFCVRVRVEPAPGNPEGGKRV